MCIDFIRQTAKSSIEAIPVSTSKLVELPSFAVRCSTLSSKSATKISWSDIPGTEVEFVTNVGFVVRRDLITCLL